METIQTKIEAYVYSLPCPILRQNMKQLLLQPFLEKKYDIVCQHLMDPSIMMFENQSTDIYFQWALQIVNEIKRN